MQPPADRNKKEQIAEKCSGALRNGGAKEIRERNREGRGSTRQKGDDTKNLGIKKCSTDKEVITTRQVKACSIRDRSS